MTDFTLHTVDSAPEASKPLLEGAKKAFGSIPNLYGVFAESPETLEAYQKISELFSKTSLNPVERNVVWLAINVENNCHYCVPAHTAIAKSQGVDDATIEALRNATPLGDDKLEALRTFALAVVRKRGEVSQADLDAFFAAGYENRQVLDVLLGVAHKTLSNYTNHISHTPVDANFAPFAWTPPARQAAE